MEREVFSLNDLPGLHTRAIIKSGETFGTSDIVFRSVEKRFNAAMRFNNYGRESVGEWRVEGDLSFNNPFHIGDQFTVNLLHAEGGELDSLQFSYNLPLNVKGTRLNLLASRYHYYVDPEEINRIFAGSSLKGRGDYYNAEITHPLLRNRRTSVLIGAGVSRTLTRQSGSGLLTPTAFNKRGDITLLNLLGSWSYLHADKQSLSNITAQFSTNFRTNNGVNRTTAEPDENAQKAKLQIDAAHLRRLPHDWTLYLKATGVYSVLTQKNSGSGG